MHNSGPEYGPLIADMQVLSYPVLRMDHTGLEWGIGDLPARGDALCSQIRENVACAFQPIVNIHTGAAFGFEALMRGHAELGFATPAGLLAEARKLGRTLEVEMILREKAITGFVAFAADQPARLFVNVNTHALQEPGYGPEQTTALLRRHGLPISRFCLEVSEAEALDVSRLAELIDRWPERPSMALDDFGSGYSGLRVLCESKPDLIKVDRFFIAGIDSSGEKKLFLSQIVSLAHSLGISVVAEGVETEAEFRVCREIGCDLAQGYLIARPSLDAAAHLRRYPLVTDMNRRDRRAPARQKGDLRAQIQPVEPLRTDAPVNAVLDGFRRAGQRAYIPVVDEAAQPIGLVHEAQLRQYVYSRYGRDVLANRSVGFRLRDFVTPCLTFDVGTGVDDVLTAAATRSGDPAVLVVEEQRYIGLLDAGAIVRSLHERKLLAASDQNPLTKLAGNLQIADFVAAVADADHQAFALAYFDFDHFKAFNDTMGFRQGDRAILMFAALLRRRFDGNGHLLGHIGGDDFFLGLPCGPGPIGEEELRPKLLALVQQFAEDAQSFYDPEMRAAGTMKALGRDGQVRQVPLLSVSCGCLLVPARQPGAEPPMTMDGLSTRLAGLKREAKGSASKLVIAPAA